jgi:hypothetical protein
MTPSSSPVAIHEGVRYETRLIGELIRRRKLLVRRKPCGMGVARKND